jgi:hypothetical protein
VSMAPSLSLERQQSSVDHGRRGVHEGFSGVCGVSDA